MPPVMVPAIRFRPVTGSGDEKNSGEAAPTVTALSGPAIGSVLPQFAITRTVTGPGGRSGTWTLIWLGKTPVMKALTPPNVTQTPPRFVGSLPETRSAGCSVRKAPDERKLLP